MNCYASYNIFKMVHVYTIICINIYHMSCTGKKKEFFRKNSTYPAVFRRKTCMDGKKGIDRTEKSQYSKELKTAPKGPRQEEDNVSREKSCFFKMQEAKKKIAAKMKGQRFHRFFKRQNDGKKDKSCIMTSAIFLRNAKEQSVCTGGKDISQESAAACKGKGRLFPNI